MYSHVIHLSVGPSNGTKPTPGQRRTLSRVGMEPRASALDNRCSTNGVNRVDGRRLGI